LRASESTSKVRGRRARRYLLRTAASVCTWLVKAGGLGEWPASGRVPIARGRAKSRTLWVALNIFEDLR
jgi:hypothetical protein